jgi:hypothetical protein
MDRILGKDELNLVLSYVAARVANECEAQALREHSDALSARLAECERERDLWQSQSDKHRAHWMKVERERDELRACHEAELGVCYQHCPEVQALEQANRELREQLDCSVDRSGLTRRAHTHSAALTPEVKK